MSIKISIVNQLSPKDIKELSEGLVHAVNSGASVGFLADFSRLKAEQYWQEVEKEINGNLLLLIAKEGNEIVGSVQLEQCQKDNGAHRAEVQKLFVNPSHQRKQIASKLMAQVELLARDNQVSLLVLDTQSGSGAEPFYQQLGWVKSGEIPNFALSPEGQLCATSYYYKVLH